MLYTVIYENRVKFLQSDKFDAKIPCDFAPTRSLLYSHRNNQQNTLEEIQKTIVKFHSIALLNAIAFNLFVLYFKS